MKRPAPIFRVRLRHLASGRVDAAPNAFLINFAAEALMAEAEELKTLNPCSWKILINNSWRVATLKGRVPNTRFILIKLKVK